MLNKEKAAEIFAKLKRYATADEIELFIYGGHSALTRFANNTIHQNVAEDNVGISVRTVFSGRTARATTNKLDDESLRRVVRSSESLAKVQHPDPDLLPMSSGNGDKSTIAPSRYFDQTAALEPGSRADVVKKIVNVAEKHKLITAGIFSNSKSFEGIFNSKGLSQWHNQTSSEISITMLGDDSSGWQKANSPDVANLDGTTLAETAASRKNRPPTW